MDIPSLIAYTEERNKKAGSEIRDEVEERAGETNQHTVAEKLGESTAEEEAMNETDARSDIYQDDVGFMIHSSFFH